MALRIVHDDGLDKVIVICDWCDKQIESAEDGNYQWVMKDSVGIVDESPIYFTHKRCCYAFEHYNGGRGPVRTKHFGAIGLQCLPVFLANNLEVNWVHATRSARLMAGFDPDIVPPRPEPEEWRRIRQAVFVRDRHICQYCGRKSERLECDHIVPISKGGSNTMDNLITACFDCNRSKRAHTLEEWIVIRTKG